jgi:hypothetical protein
MSIKAYNPAWPYHEAMQSSAARWQRRGLLTAAQQQTIQAAYPLDFYRPGLFLRIGLFIFACIAAFGGIGFLALVTELDHFKTLAFLSAVLTWVALEFFIKSSRLYHAGSDTALLYIALGWTSVWLAALFEDILPQAFHHTASFGNGYISWLLGPFLLLFLVATIRFADRLVAAATYLLCLALVVNWLLQLPMGRLLLPFALMLLAVGLYRVVALLRQRPDYLYYRACLQMVKVLTLATFYLAGNYYIVREGNALLSGSFMSQQIPFAPVFYLFTSLIPAVYVALGLRYHSRIWLLTGLAAVAFSLFTLRYYRSLLPPEIAAVLAGLVLLAVAVWAARYLRPARHGLTSLPNDEQLPHFNLESLVVAQTAVVPAAPTPSFQFGGGHSGGGGADGTY